MRRASDCLRYVACCAALAAASALPRPVVHDAPLPPVVRVCVVIYPPFILERVRTRSAPCGALALRGLCCTSLLRKRHAQPCRATADAAASQSWYGKSFNAITYNANFKDPASLSGAASGPPKGPRAKRPRYAPTKGLRFAALPQRHAQTLHTLCARRCSAQLRIGG
jgi:hypothetical protein